MCANPSVHEAIGTRVVVPKRRIPNVGPAWRPA